MIRNKLNTALSPEQARYALWLEEKMPRLLPLFDFDRKEYLTESVDRYLGVASHSQAIMCRFVIGVWRHDNHYNFDFTEAASILEPEQMKIVTDWLTHPFWP